VKFVLQYGGHATARRALSAMLSREGSTWLGFSRNRLLFTLKLEAVRSSEMSVSYHITHGVTTQRTTRLSVFIAVKVSRLGLITNFS